MKNRTIGNILVALISVVSLLVVARNLFSVLFSFPSLNYLKFQFSYYYHALFVKNPLFIVVVAAVLIVAVLLICQKLEHSRLERETDFIQAEHLCKSGDESMQGYADAAEIRLQKQNKISAEKYGKRAPRSRYYNN